MIVNITLIYCKLIEDSLSTYLERKPRDRRDFNAQTFVVLCIGQDNSLVLIIHV